ncbi:MAG: hypothetical protein GWP91_15165 [Rhodobacterales bacterium]|nr:hypothetical protein [Rhodobacterales bacterium]
MRRTLIPLLFLAACSSDGPSNDSGTTTVAACDGSGTSSVVLGTGAGGAFVELEAGDVAVLQKAPQGGWGIKVRGRTTGLTDGTVSVTLDTKLDGVLSATFTNEAVNLFCQDDGTGLFTDQVVGLDATLYSSNDDLFPLNGSDVELVVTVTDSNDKSQSGTVIIEMEVGG